LKIVGMEEANITKVVDLFKNGMHFGKVIPAALLQEKIANNSSGNYVYLCSETFAIKIDNESHWNISYCLNAAINIDLDPKSVEGSIDISVGHSTIVNSRKDAIDFEAKIVQ